MCVIISFIIQIHIFELKNKSTIELKKSGQLNLFKHHKLKNKNSCINNN